MEEYVIVKYAEDLWKRGAPIGASIFGSYSANEVGIEKETYTSIEEATPDLEKLVEFNPTVGYGIVKLLQNDGISR